MSSPFGDIVCSTQAALVRCGSVKTFRLETRLDSSLPLANRVVLVRVYIRIQDGTTSLYEPNQSSLDIIDAGSALGILSRRTIVILIPALVLAADFLFFPTLFETRPRLSTASLGAILTNRTLLLGNYRGHRIFVSVDDISDPGYLAFLNRHSTALIISAFVEKGSPVGGALQSAVLAKLSALAPQDYLRLEDELAPSRNFAAGEVLDFELHLPVGAYSKFRIDRLLIVILPIGHPDPDNLRSAIPEVMNIARRKGIANVIFPPLATNWTNESNGNALTEGEFFRVFFESLPVQPHPRNVYLSLFKGWPSLELEKATAGLNSAWRDCVQKTEASFPVYRWDFRVTFAFLELCLIVCSSSVKFTLKNVTLIIVSFLGLALGTNATLDFLTQGHGPIFRVAIQIFLLVSLAFGFPVIATWNPKDIFDKAS